MAAGLSLLCGQWLRPPALSKGPRLAAGALFLLCALVMGAGQLGAPRDSGLSRRLSTKLGLPSDAPESFGVRLSRWSSRLLELAANHDPVRYHQLIMTKQPSKTPRPPPKTHGKPTSMEQTGIDRPWRLAKAA